MLATVLVLAYFGCTAALICWAACAINYKS